MQRDVINKIQNFRTAKRHHKIWLRAACLMMAVVVFCTTYALILPAITLSSDTYCGYDEHVHDDSCYTLQEQTVTKKVFTCDPGAGVDFVIHTHDELCGDTCPLTKREAHTHTDECYGEAGEIICDEVEIEEHTHDESCEDENGIIACGKPQIVSHQHTDECCEETAETAEVSVLSCNLTEHTHEEKCSTTPESLSFTYSDSLVSGTITLPWSKDLPSDLSCTVVTLSEGDDEYANMLESVTEALAEQDMTQVDVQIYQLEWESEGNTYTMPDNVTQTVELVAVEQNDDESLTAMVLSESDGAQEPDAAGSSDISTLAAENEPMAASDDAEPVAALMDNDSTYVATTVAEASESGIMVLSLDDGITTFAVVVTKSLPTGTAYYKRVDSLSEMKTGDKTKDSGDYVFVAADGVIALGNNDVKSTNNYGGQTGNDASWSSSTFVSVHPVRDENNNEYFVIYDSTTSSYISPSSNANLHWDIYDYSGVTVTSRYYYGHYLHGSEYANGYFFVPNKKTGGYLWLGNDKYEKNNGDWDYYWSIAIGFQRNNTEKTWKIFAKSDSGLYYLQANPYSSSNLITQRISTDTSYTNTWYDSQYIYTQTFNYTFQNDFVIYKYVGTNLSAYDDEAVADSIKTEDAKNEVPQATKPTDSGNNEVSSTSDTISGSVTSSNTSELRGATLSYVSDASTSSIEETFNLSGENLTDVARYGNQEDNDGRIMTDKSVIYGSDDYGAFNSYSTDEFSVTLSALGQEWTIQEQIEETTPVDVVFVLDLSASMLSIDDGLDVPRWYSSVNALNTVADKILEQNSQNRVGLVAFSNTAYEILNLDHYDTSNVAENELSKNKGLLSYDLYDKTFIYSDSSHPGVNSLQVSAGLRNSSGAEVAQTSLGGTVTGLWQQTFTQGALQTAYQLFSEVNSTTATISDGKGGTTTVTRQPIIIMLSDGDPTLGTYDYMNPAGTTDASGNRSGSPVYGYGEVNDVFGYYTVLSANYFKNMTSIKYNKTSKFFSIGLGFSDDDFAGKYKCAVLDPSPKRLAALSEAAKTDSQANDTDKYSGGFVVSLTNPNSHLFYHQSSRYDSTAGLQGSYMVSHGYSSDVITMTAGLLQYSNVSYADDAFFGSFTEEELTQILESILNRIQYVNDYGFLLKENTSLTITDPIGDGMAVRGSPVLRYFGTNYTASETTPGSDSTGSYTQYTYNHTATRQDNDVKEDSENTIDLSQIVVKVYAATDSRGEVVVFSVPEDAMPTYYPDLHKQFYYEEYPVRLIYKVGLSEKALNDIKQTKTEIKDMVFYTNTYSEVDSEAVADTYVNFTPDDSNPYYFSNNYKAEDIAKSENSTGTAAYSFQESVSDSVVTQTLGNNGKLTLSRAALTDITITKAWGTGTTQTDVKVYVFREKQYADGTTGDIELYNTVTLSSNNDWTATLKNPVTEGTDNGVAYTWQYYVMEDITHLNYYNDSYTDIEGHIISYVNRSVDVGTAQYAGARVYPVDGMVTITNSPQTLTIEKSWADGAENHEEDITVYVYRNKTAIQQTLPETTSELWKTVTLKKDSDGKWITTIDAPVIGQEWIGWNLILYYYDYYVVEQPIEGYTATYSSGEAKTLKVNGETVTAYPAAGTVTITNSVPPKTVTVTKEWADGKENHTSSSGCYVEVSLFAKVVKVGDESVTGYTKVDTAFLNNGDGWSCNFELYYNAKYPINGEEYAVDSFYISETSVYQTHSGSSSIYLAYYYNVDADGNRSLLDPNGSVSVSSGELLTASSKKARMQDGTIPSYTLTGPEYFLYPVSNNMIVRNVPLGQITVTKDWAEGTASQPVTVGVYPVINMPTGDGETKPKVLTSEDLENVTETYAWEVELSEANNWTYTWTDLPSTVTWYGQTYEDVTYSVHETQLGAYQPIYTDYSGNEITDTIRYTEKTTDYAVYCPDDSYVKITNKLRTSDLVLTKQWANVEENDRTAVNVNIYRVKVDDGGNAVDNTEELFTTATISAGDDNSWTTTVENLPYYCVNDNGTTTAYKYFILEAESSSDGYIVTYYDSRNVSLGIATTSQQVGNSDIYAYYVPFSLVVTEYQSSYGMTITNSKQFALPNTGGAGTNLYTLSGAILLTAGALLYIIARRRRRSKGKGGENECLSP